MATIFSADETVGPKSVERRRRMAELLMKQGMDSSPVQHWTQGLARVLQGGMGGYLEGQADKEEKANQTADAGIRSKLLGELLSGGSGAVASPAAASAPPIAGDTATVKAPNVAPEIKDGIVQTASALGIDPVDLATTISYETGGTFDPTKRGPTTKWGQHRGLIQFGEPQAKQHGVDWSNPVGSQLGPNGAVASYLKTAGVKPGMGLLDIYSAINAGAPGLYNRSDAAAGGAPGTVRDKVEQQMGGHRAKARALLSAALADMPASGATPVSQETGQEGFAIPPAPVSSVPGDDPARLRQEAQYYAQTNPEAARQMLARADAAEAAGAQPAPTPPMPVPRPQDLAVAQTPGPALTAQNFNAIQEGQPLDPVFKSEGVSQPWMGTAIPQQPAQPQMAQAPMPPPRPTDLRADMPAPGAVQAMGQMPQPAPPNMPDLTSMESGGAREFAVMEGERRNGQQPGASVPNLIQALTGGGSSSQAAQAAPAVAQAVAGAPAPSPAQVKATSGVPNEALIEALTSPRASPATQALAASILNKRIEAQKPKVSEVAPGATIVQTMPDGTVRELYKAQPKDDKPSEVREYEYAKGQGYAGTFAEYQKDMKKAGATSVNVNGGGSDKQVFDTVKESADAAKSAAVGLNAVREARKSIQGGAILGAGADAKLNLQKIGAALGIADPAKIVNTETFRSAIAPAVASLLKSTVGSANISNSDREFAEKAAGGSITLDEGTITRLLDIMERGNMTILEGHQKRMDAIYPDDVANKRERALFGVPMPAAPAAPATAKPTAPAGQTKSGVKWSIE